MRVGIISTNPRAGVIVQRDSTVDYVVSRGPATSPAPTPTPRPTAGVVTVPDVRGLSEADGLTEIGAAGLKAGARTRKNSSKVVAGDIISTDPAAGVQVKRGSTRRLCRVQGSQRDPDACSHPHAATHGRRSSACPRSGA